MQTFSAGEGDYCAEFILPKVPAQDNDVTAGVILWASGANIAKADKKFSFNMYSDGTTQLNRASGGEWTTITNQKTSIETEPDTIHELRVLAKGGKLTLFVDGAQVKAIRAQMPDGELHFGVYARVEKASDADPVVKFKSFKVTTGD